MSDPALAGVATLGRIRDLHKSKMAAIEIGSNSKVAITLDIIQLEGRFWCLQKGIYTENIMHRLKKIVVLQGSHKKNCRYFDPAKYSAGCRFRENCAENVMLGVRTYFVHTIHF